MLRYVLGHAGKFYENCKKMEDWKLLCQEIGSGSVVGAGSLVLNTVPSNAMVAGAPATVKKRYKPD